MSNIVKLADISSEPRISAATVDLLCDLLVRAQKGEIVEIAVVCRDGDGGISNRSSLEPSFEILGALMVLQHDIAEKINNTAFCEHCGQ